LIVVGLVIAVTIILVVKREPQVEAMVVEQPATPPATLYKYAIVNGEPTLAFFHSNTCDSCLQMIDIVNEIYPEFDGQVVLVDVNVYDPQNEFLISMVGVDFIPTLVFYDRAREEQVHVGVMDGGDLRKKLVEISQEIVP
jgi:thiol-disulfide isomerase/thioredoxin